MKGPIKTGPSRQLEELFADLVGDDEFDDTDYDYDAELLCDTCGGDGGCPVCGDCEDTCPCAACGGNCCCSECGE